MFLNFTLKRQIFYTYFSISASLKSASSSVVAVALTARFTVWRFLEGYALMRMMQLPTFRSLRQTERRRRKRRSIVHLSRRRRKPPPRKFRPMSSAGGWMTKISWEDPKGQRSVLYMSTKIDWRLLVHIPQAFVQQSKPLWGLAKIYVNVM